MNSHALQEILDTQGISRDAYSLFGESVNECYCLSDSMGKWAVYYSERGEETGRQEFQTESKACEYLLALLLRDLG